MVDLWFIVDLVLEYVWLIWIVCYVNDDKLYFVVECVWYVVSWFCELVIVCFGFVFKVDIDDLCESLVMKIVEMLVE